MSPLSVAVVVCSTRPERVGPAVAQWVMDQVANRADATYELVDLADQDLPLLDEPQPASAQEYTKDHTKAWSRKIAGYDGFVFVFPEYNRGLPAAFKNALDFLYVEWNDKVAGMVCYGSSEGLRAAEQLKQVLGELQIATVRGQVAISTYDDMQDYSKMTPRPYQASNLDTMLTQLVRWGGALKTLR
ncbi:NADPH-dependent FMN reductase [Allobranchiibius sp. CTAmp26]|uniref:NADPH-dependent FMN reductase n=1 Tax=Allobranchiibius sp. CTAmp26 TaxID=2815214 RepID=UPI001AA1B852|nr:NAD(P)H-dependent oxidoreductase [Allobranchiibius sp. CTAmp26]MBO1754957.1 NAD(P)H-dependent oxidoreductase [Allobranchiibius sp. CTAmp26]